VQRFAHRQYYLRDRLDDGRRRRRHDHPQARACFQLFVTGLHINTVYADPPGRVVAPAAHAAPSTITITAVVAAPPSAIAAAAVAVAAAAIAITPECPAQRAAASATTAVAAAVAVAVATATVAIAAAAIADAIATATVAIATAAVASTARCPILASRAGNLHDLGHLRGVRPGSIPHQARNVS
jgi:hypothetical protein